MKITSINFMFPIWIAVALIGVFMYDVSWWVPGLILLYGIELKYTF